MGSMILLQMYGIDNADLSRPEKEDEEKRHRKATTIAYIASDNRTRRSTVAKKGSPLHR